MQNISRDCHRRVLPGNRHSGRTLYAKAQSEPDAREENITAAGLPATKKPVRARNSIDGNDDPIVTSVYRTHQSKIEIRRTLRTETCTLASQSSAPPVPLIPADHK